MIDTIIEELKASSAYGYEINDIQTEGVELYFIRHRLDQYRIKQVGHTEVKVFVRSADGKAMGSSSAEISPAADKGQIKEMIGKLIAQAGLLKNEPFELNRASLPAGTGRPVDAAKIAEDFIKALAAVPETASEDINSYEIFADGITRRTINSNGIDVTVHYPSSAVEVIVNARKPGHDEIELYRMYRSGTCDRSALVQDIADTLKEGKDKLEVQPTPALKKAPVVFSTDAAVRIYNFFLQKLNAESVYQKTSGWKIGEPIDPDIRGDRLTIEALQQLPNSNADFPVDTEGAPIHDRMLMKDGIPVTYWGSRQFSQYLGLSDSSIVYNYRVTGGTKAAAELRTGSYLEVKEFSAFMVSWRGDIIGEIRLGYWHDHGKVTIVSGGSISGSMNDCLRDMHVSMELRQYNNALIPAVTRLENASVTGIEKK